MAGVDRAPVTRGLLGGVEDVLHAEQKTAPRRVVAARRDRGRLGTRAVGIEELERVDRVLPLVDHCKGALDRVDRVDPVGHVTPVMVTLPAVSRTVTCTSRCD